MGGGLREIAKQRGVKNGDYVQLFLTAAERRPARLNGRAFVKTDAIRHEVRWLQKDMRFMPLAKAPERRIPCIEEPYLS
jgi:hypothetical protein